MCTLYTLLGISIHHNAPRRRITAGQTAYAQVGEFCEWGSSPPSDTQVRWHFEGSGCTLVHMTIPMSALDYLLAMEDARIEQAWADEARAFADQPHLLPAWRLEWEKTAVYAALQLSVALRRAGWSLAPPSYVRMVARQRGWVE